MNTSQPDQRKAAYSAASSVYNKVKSMAPSRLISPPAYSAFGLTESEAKDVELNGYSTDCLPSILQPKI